VSQPRPPTVLAIVMCHPRALKWSAEYESVMATQNPTTQGGTVRS
jgi:hypothetical protein